jgi:hypothetical protein
MSLTDISRQAAMARAVGFFAISGRRNAEEEA